MRRRFELNPRPGTAEADAVRGARRRVVLHGRLTLDGAAFDARWPRGRALRADAHFTSAKPDGGVAPRTQFAGEAFTPRGRQLPGGTRIEAYVGASRCGVASVRRTGSFSGFILEVVGPDSIPAARAARRSPSASTPGPRSTPPSTSRGAR